MARNARCIWPGLAYHVTERGSNRQTVFFSNSDRQYYLALLRENLADCGTRVLAYCLLSNHLTNEFQPGSRTERILVTDMAQSHWLTQRAINLQTNSIEDPKAFALYLGYQTTHQRAYYRALEAATAGRLRPGPLRFAISRRGSLRFGSFLNRRTHPAWLRFFRKPP